jgi:hypothetical protein
MTLHAFLKQQKVLSLDRAHDSVFVWHLDQWGNAKPDTLSHFTLAPLHTEVQHSQA